jgi:hypothetical protein
MSKVSGLAADGAAWWSLFMIVLFCSLPLIAHPLINALAWLLDGLDSFGAGWW